MAEEAVYTLLVDWNDDGDYYDADEDCSADFVIAELHRGFASPLTRVAQVGRGVFTLNNHSRQYSPALNAHIRPGATIDFSMTYGGSTVTLFFGQIESILPTSGQYDERRVQFVCVDSMARIDAVEAKIPLQVDITADELVELVTDEVGGLLATDYEVGINVFATSADRWTHEPVSGSGATLYERVSATTKIMDAVTADWGVFFIAGDGTPTFYNRHHIALDDTTELTLTTPTALGYRMAISDIFNIAEVLCVPRSVGTPLSVVWQLTGGTIKIGPGETVTVNCAFVDPLNDAVEIGAADCVSLVVGGDATATSDEAGEGDDKTAQIGLASTFYGDKATLALTNNDAATIYIQTLRIRGTPIRSLGPYASIKSDATSEAAYGSRRLAINAILLSRAYESDRLAEYLLDVYKDPQDVVTGVAFCANTGATLMAAARDLELFDRVVLTEVQTGLVAYAGFIYGLSHSIGDNGHWVTMDLMTAYDVGGDPFRLETAPPGGGSALNSGDILLY